MVLNYTRIERNYPHKSLNSDHGRLALYKAVSRYKPARFFKFTGYEEKFTSPDFHFAASNSE